MNLLPKAVYDLLCTTQLPEPMLRIVALYGFSMEFKEQPTRYGSLYNTIVCDEKMPRTAFAFWIDKPMSIYLIPQMSPEFTDEKNEIALGPGYYDLWSVKALRPYLSLANYTSSWSRGRRYYILNGNVTIVGPSKWHAVRWLPMATIK